MTLSARIEKVYFTGNRWASISIVAKDGKRYKAAGVIDSPVEGYDIELTGDMTMHEKYGMQIAVKSSRVMTNSSRKGLINYLSNFVSGVGPAIAERIVDRFGMQTYSIIENEPETLAVISGISESKARKIQESHLKNKAYSELAEYLGEDASVHQIHKIYEKYGEKSLRVVKSNPYVLIYEVDGIGFKIADRLAVSSGIAPDDPRRIGAAITYLLRSISSEGHCFCRIENLESMIRSLFKKEKNDIPLDSLGRVLGMEVQSGRLLLVDDDKLYRKEIYEAEFECSQYINALVREPVETKITPAAIQRVVMDTEMAAGFLLTERQKDAIAIPIRNRLSVITGGPGSGKSTIILGLVNAWKQALGSITLSPDFEKHICLCAPTGKASRRMADITGLTAKTVHNIVYRMQKEIKDSLVIVDEASMLDLQMAAGLLRIAYKNNCSIVFIGDADQLDPIGPGNIFKDLIRAPMIPTVMLDVSHRQKGSIEKNARRINNGQGFASYELDKDFRFIEASKEESQKAMLDAYVEAVRQYGVKEVVCVVPRRVDGQTASRILNPLLRDIINPDMPGKTVPGCFFRKDDRVMYLENNQSKDIYNGDCGSVIELNPATKAVTVQFDDGRIVELSQGEASELTLAYAMTVHKAQGSQFNAVIVSQCWEDYRMLSRPLLYTAVTRAKKYVAIVGEIKAINCAVGNNDPKNRNTRLYSLLE